MSTRSIIALYPSLAKAELAEHDLVALGIAARDIALAARSAAFGEAGVAPLDHATDADRHEQEYFDWLVGARVPATSVQRYRALLDDGAALLCVRVAEENADDVRRILRRHSGVGARRIVDPGYAGAKPGLGAAGDLDEYLVGQRSDDNTVG